MQQEEVGGRRAYFLATVESVCKRKLAEYNQEGAEGEVCRQNQSRVKLLRLKLDPFVIIMYQTFIHVSTFLTSDRVCFATFDYFLFFVWFLQQVFATKDCSSRS